jgi:hydrogenase nickel incorporation protein HypA/HybF
MHEMAIAQSILDIAFGEMEKHAARRVQRIKVSIGEFSGVVKDALEFAFLVLTPSTPAKGASIDIEVIPLSAKCAKCGPVECKLNDLKLLCPTCDAPLAIETGREMRVDYIDLD